MKASRNVRSERGMALLDYALLMTFCLTLSFSVARIGQHSVTQLSLVSSALGGGTDETILCRAEGLGGDLDCNDED